MIKLKYIKFTLIVFLLDRNKYGILVQLRMW